MFVCGPTVYDSSHIGHARTYISFDVIARYLRHLGYKVKYLQNITDIDDKIIDRAKKENKDPLKLAGEFEKIYYQDMKSLGINSVSKYAPATKYIKQIVSQVKRLKEKGFAYEIPGDGFYFDLSKLTDYGKLSGRTTEGAEDAVSRIDESVNKRNKCDFALWKFSKPGEPKWRVKWEKEEPQTTSARLPARQGSEDSDKSTSALGRPGWHIEDTAITEKHFGPQYDLHGGARDLIFPHHEAEIAQMESISGKKPFVKYWLHTGFLTINGQKMSKSLGNFITIRDSLKNYSPEVLRFLFLSTHYRSPIDYQESAVKSAWAGVQRIEEFIHKLSNIRHLGAQLPSNMEKILLETKKGFTEAMGDDFSTPRAIAVIFKMIKEFNPLLTESKVDKKSAKKIKNLLEEFNEVLGIIPEKTKKTPDEILKMTDTREKLRRDKRYSEADDLRAQIRLKGYEIEDTVYGPLIKKLPS